MIPTTVHFDGEEFSVPDQPCQHRINLTVNGRPCAINVDPHRTLLEVLRDQLGMTGTKEGCGEGECGSCTVIMDGQTVNSCLVLAVQADGADIITIEGLAAGGQPHPLQATFVSEGAVQCGYCTAGMIMSAKHLLDQNPEPSLDDIKVALSGNLCRCTGYVKIISAVRKAAELIKDNATA